jgi:peptidyl-prolyl cis-trans isomerase SurA
MAITYQISKLLNLMSKAWISITRISYPLSYSLVFIWFFIPVPEVFTRENNAVLLKVENREITAEEFLRLWKKSDLFSDQAMLPEYLDLFIDFQLKVAHARDEGIHNEPSLRDALTQYRKQLAVPFLGDADTEEKLVKEAYERLQYDINASHILVKLVPGYSPEDTLMAWEKALQIRERILEGEPFEIIASATSDDPSAKINSGNLGYFTALQMLYPFENEVYRAKTGETGMPVRTRFGYHIIRVNEKIKSRGEIKTAHIMVGFNKYNEQDAKARAAEIHSKLTAGEDFGKLARENSTDFNTAGNGGELSWFGSGRFIPEFENAAFTLKNPGDISEPVLTPFGWHIIKLIDRREIPPLDQVRDRLLAEIREYGGNRSGLIRSALVNRLKKEWGFSENPGALEIFYQLVDARLFDGEWPVPSNQPLDGVLFSITGKNITQRDFAEFISENAYVRKPWPLPEYINSLYSDFVENWLIRLEEDSLEKKYPEFRYMINEYMDGMMLYEISEREVWSRAKRDTAGLRKFHLDHIDDYMWGKRLSATIFSAGNERLARRAAWRARRSSWFGSRDNDWIVNRLNRSAGDEVVTYEQGLFSRGDKEITDRVAWEEGLSDIHFIDGLYMFVLISDILHPEPKTMEEAEEELVFDYREYLEKNWVTGLRNKYNVTVNKEVLNTIN